jgi:hypothetical protein
MENDGGAKVRRYLWIRMQASVVLKGYNHKLLC